MSLSLTVGTNFDDALIDRIKNTAVSELYGATDLSRLGGGRPLSALLHLSKDRIRQHIRKTRDAGMNFSYLFNALCYGNHEFHAKNQQAVVDTVGMLNLWGVNSYTVSSPFLMDLIKRNFPDVTIKASVFCQVDALSRLQYYLSKGADEIAFPFDVNRDFAFLKAARKATSAKLTLVGNEVCLYKCMYSPFHGCAVGHDSQKVGKAGSPLAHNYWVMRCTKDRYENPEEFFKARWIRPEDLDIYEELGIDAVKLATRDKTTDWIVRCVKAYDARSYSGNLLDILNSLEGFMQYQRETDPAFQKRMALSTRLPNAILRAGMALAGKMNFIRQKNVFDTFGRIHSPLLVHLLHCYANAPVLFIDNQKLDGFLEIFQQIDCNMQDCGSCGHCRRFQNRALKCDPEELEEHRKKIEKFFQLLLPPEKPGNP